MEINKAEIPEKRKEREKQTGEIRQKEERQRMKKYFYYIHYPNSHNDSVQQEL